MRYSNCACGGTPYFYTELDSWKDEWRPPAVLYRGVCCKSCGVHTEKIEFGDYNQMDLLDIWNALITAIINPVPIYDPDELI